MRGLARDAVKMATPFDLPGNLNKEEFIKVCAQPSEYNEEEKEEREKKEGEIRARLEFYASVGADSRDYYLPDGSERLSASYLVALLTDLPPQWILDCATNRKGNIPVPEVSDARHIRA